ncbi:cathepsin 8-like [Condylostylus longicornis]|uniref:cathepsin 8-like n=1 Tax=Condylostylus longicornis TaxID=2530218 RepID=UPI00244E0914|nr:cathepsin 8-like [Condylostylus longicornis]
MAEIEETDSLDVTDEEWENYKKKFQKNYSPTEDSQRRKIYEASKKVIVEHNKKFKAGEVPFAMSINQFADRKPEEAGGCMKKALGK